MKVIRHYPIGESDMIKSIEDTPSLFWAEFEIPVWASLLNVEVSGSYVVISTLEDAREDAMMETIRVYLLPPNIIMDEYVVSAEYVGMIYVRPGEQRWVFVHRDIHRKRSESSNEQLKLAA